MKSYFHYTIWMLAWFAPSVSCGVSAEMPPDLPQKVTVCELLNNRTKWNHKLVEVTGLASHGFEDSSFSDPECPSRYGSLWMSYGGIKRTQTPSTVNDIGPDRTTPLVVEKIPIPLVEDAAFRRFDDLLHKPDSTGHVGAIIHATVVARFFAGKIQHYPAGDAWGGYGHLGCCSLFIIQQVLSVEEASGKLLDGSDRPDQPKSYPFCDLMREEPNLFAQQRAAERNASFPEAQQAATSFLQNAIRTPEAADITLKALSTAPARIVYEAHVRGSGALYQVVVSRPLWLSYYAKDPDRVAWLVLAGYAVGEESMASCRGGTTSLLKE